MQLSPLAAAALLVLAVARPASAAPAIGLELGAGFQAYTGALGDVTRGGAAYDYRAIVGLRSRVALEVAYFGAWNEAEAKHTAEGTAVNIYSNAGEALARLNFLGNRSRLRPFVAGGANYTRIDSQVAGPVGALDLDEYRGIGFPLAGGVQVLPAENFTVSARGNYTVFSGILDARLGNQWGGAMSVGVVF